MTKFHGFIGTYTKGDSEGIYSFIFDTETAAIEAIRLAAKIENPTYLTISENKEYLYSVAKEGENGGVAAYSLNRETGELHFLNQQTVKGSPPCHVSVNRNNQHLLSSNYHKGTAAAYKINSEEGTIHTNPSIAQHQGEHADQKPHTHFAAFTPDEKYITVIDLGIDQLLTYKLTNNQLVKVNHLSFTAGSGPRHLAFHPNEKVAYLMTEFSSEVIVLQYDTNNGAFKEIQTISTIPADFSSNNQGSAIKLSSDGRFVYAGNRGHNSIAVFNIDTETYKLTFVEHISTEGDWPRDFSLDPTEEFMIASNQESSNLTVYKRNTETGELTLIQSDITVPHPVCVKFI
ncbi:lactonase family protein [Niallia endozanthoxylica]|uniref:Lactonase family protein n=1 Tax=Niallia endozanthoxylica TaxID=2036016 RepID=A0A5J5I9G2_9BACI|nr:lactonase family protein [Niallia endozanthoxylica]KAA9031603.1 lactonase family protein [Niallia endozanthoxylica]